MPPKIELDQCNGCGICDRHCPLDILRVDKSNGKAFVHYPDECWHCGACRIDCPTKAITIEFPEEMLSPELSWQHVSKS